MISGHMYDHSGHMYDHSGHMYDHSGHMYDHSGHMYDHSGHMYDHSGHMYDHSGHMYDHSGHMQFVLWLSPCNTQRCNSVQCLINVTLAALTKKIVHLVILDSGDVVINPIRNEHVVMMHILINCRFNSSCYRCAIIDIILLSIISMVQFNIQAQDMDG